MARTTIAFDDDLLRQLRERAAREGRPLQDVANDVLRRGLQAVPPKRFELKLPTWNAKLQPGITDEDIGNRARLHDLFDRLDAEDDASR